jgi:hypothetical protein
MYLRSNETRDFHVSTNFYKIHIHDKDVSYNIQIVHKRLNTMSVVADL